MKSDIQLDINTKYNDEGLKKLEQGLTKASKTAKTATGAVNQIAGALGGLENSAGKAVGALTGLFQSFTTGGVWGLAAAGVMLVVNKIVDGFNRAKQASKEAAETARKHWLDALDKISQRANINITAIDKSSKSDSEKYSLDTQHLTQQQMLEVEKVKQAGITRRANLSEDERAVDKAKEDIEIARMVKDYSSNSGKARLNEIDSQIDARSQGQREKDTATSKIKSEYEKQLRLAAEYNSKIKELRKKQDEEMVSQMQANPNGIIIAPYQKEIDRLTAQHTSALDKLYGSRDDKGNRKSDEGLESRYKAAKKAADDYRGETFDLNLDSKRRNILSQIELDDTKQTTSVRQAEERLAQIQSNQSKKQEADEKSKREKSATISAAVDKLMDDSGDIVKSTSKQVLMQMLSGVQSNNKSLADTAKDESKSEDERKKALSDLTEGKKKETDIQHKLLEIEKQEIEARKTKIKELNDDKLKKLNDEIDKSKDAISKWRTSFNENSNTGFADWNKGQVEEAKRGDVVIGKDENGEDIKISGKQKRNVDANLRTLERLRKIRNPNKRTQDEIARRERYDDMFNPEKIKDRQDKLKQAEQAKEKLIKQQAEDLKKIREAVIGGITL